MNFYIFFCDTVPLNYTFRIITIDTHQSLYQ